MRKFPNKKAREKFYQEEGKENYQQRLYGNPSDWIHHRIKNLSLSAVKGVLKDKARAKLLDIGCAEGIYLREISSFIDEGIGIDIADNKIKRARQLVKQFKNLKFVSADFLDYPAKKEMFDIIFSTETLEHIPYIEKVLKKINKLLKPQGWLVISVPTDKEMLFYHYRGDWKKSSGHLYNWSRKEFQKLLDGADFQAIETYGVNNFFTQIISWVARLILSQFKKEKKKKMNKKLIRANTKKAINYLSKGGRFFYRLDGFFTSLPFFKNFNNYNIFVCQKT
jgi:ubiquinone/menaquinone biosynthesis C-methylase UbiE